MALKQNISPLLCLPALLFFAACTQQKPADADSGSHDSIAYRPDTPELQGNNTKNDTMIKSETPAAEDKDTADELASFQTFYNELTKAFQSGDAAAINRFIHPKWGIYVIYRPGAIDVIDTAASIERYFKKIYMGRERLKDMACQLEEKHIPKVTCDKEYKGCFTEADENYGHITELKKALLQYDFIKSFPPAEQQRVKAFEARVKRHVVNFDKAIGLSFLRIDGRWYLGVIDLARYSCSA